MAISNYEQTNLKCVMSILISRVRPGTNAGVKTVHCRSLEVMDQDKIFKWVYVDLVILDRDFIYSVNQVWGIIRYFLLGCPCYLIGGYIAGFLILHLDRWS